MYQLFRSFSNGPNYARDLIKRLFYPGQTRLQGSFFKIDNMTFSHPMASVNGIQLYYVIGGHGDPVVLLHGFPQSWYGWHHIMPILALLHDYFIRYLLTFY